MSSPNILTNLVYINEVHYDTAQPFGPDVLDNKSASAASSASASSNILTSSFQNYKTLEKIERLGKSVLSQRKADIKKICKDYKFKGSCIFDAYTQPFSKLQSCSLATSDIIQTSVDPTDEIYVCESLSTLGVLGKTGGNNKSNQVFPRGFRLQKGKYSNHVSSWMINTHLITQILDLYLHANFELRNNPIFVYLDKPRDRINFFKSILVDLLAASHLIELASLIQTKLNNNKINNPAYRVICKNFISNLVYLCTIDLGGSNDGGGENIDTISRILYVFSLYILSSSTTSENIHILARADEEGQLKEFIDQQGQSKQKVYIQNFYDKPMDFKDGDLFKMMFDVELLGVKQPIYHESSSSEFPQTTPISRLQEPHGRNSPSTFFKVAGGNSPGTPGKRPRDGDSRSNSASSRTQFAFESISSSQEQTQRSTSGPLQSYGKKAMPSGKRSQISVSKPGNLNPNSAQQSTNRGILSTISSHWKKSAIVGGGGTLGLLQYYVGDAVVQMGSSVAATNVVSGSFYPVMLSAPAAISTGALIVGGGGVAVAVGIYVFRDNLKQYFSSYEKSHSSHKSSSSSPSSWSGAYTPTNGRSATPSDLNSKNMFDSSANVHYANINILGHDNHNIEFMFENEEITSSTYKIYDENRAIILINRFYSMFGSNHNNVLYEEETIYNPMLIRGQVYSLQPEPEYDENIPFNVVQQPTPSRQASDQRTDNNNNNHVVPFTQGGNNIKHKNHRSQSQGVSSSLSSASASPVSTSVKSSGNQIAATQNINNALSLHQAVEMSNLNRNINTDGNKDKYALTTPNPYPSLYSEFSNSTELIASDSSLGQAQSNNDLVMPRPSQLPAYMLALRRTHTSPTTSPPQQLESYLSHVLNDALPLPDSDNPIIKKSRK